MLLISASKGKAQFTGSQQKAGGWGRKMSNSLVWGPPITEEKGGRRLRRPFFLTIGLRSAFMVIQNTLEEALTLSVTHE